MSKVLLLTSLLLLAAGGLFLVTKCGLGCGSSVDLQAYREDGWFGKSVPGTCHRCAFLWKILFLYSQIVLSAGQLVPKDAETIRPFKLNISDDDLRDLKTRLSKARYVDHIAGTHFNYGFNAEHLKKVVEYWRSTYNWRKEEAKINAYPHFHTQIEGLNIHYGKSRCKIQSS